MSALRLTVSQRNGETTVNISKKPGEGRAWARLVGPIVFDEAQKLYRLATGAELTEESIAGLPEYGSAAMPRSYIEVQVK